MRSISLRVLILASIVCAGGLVAMIVLSSREMSLAAGLRATTDTLWGITTMGDLYVGLFVVAGWIAYRERSPLRAAPWILGLLLLGNLTTVIYLLVAAARARSLDDLFRPVPR